MKGWCSSKICLTIVFICARYKSESEFPPPSSQPPLLLTWRWFRPEHFLWRLSEKGSNYFFPLALGRRAWKRVMLSGHQGQGRERWTLPRPAAVLIGKRCREGEKSDSRKGVEEAEWRKKGGRERKIESVWITSVCVCGACKLVCMWRDKKNVRIGKEIVHNAW